MVTDREACAKIRSAENCIAEERHLVFWRFATRKMGGSEVILRKMQSLIVDDLKLKPRSEREMGQDSEDDGDICTPKAEPPTEDDRPLE